MEKTIITYRGKPMFVLGHIGTFIMYVLWLAFGGGWLSLGIVFSIDGEKGIFPTICYIFGVVFITIACCAMYSNIKEFVDKKRKAKELKGIKALLSIKKSSYATIPYTSNKEHHLLIQNREKKDFVVNNYVWSVFSEILLFSKYFRGKQVDLVKIIYDGLGIDSYYFELDNHLIKDKFIRGQEVITITPDRYNMCPLYTRLTVKLKNEPFFLSPDAESAYSCVIYNTNISVIVAESEIMDYEEWSKNK